MCDCDRNKNISLVFNDLEQKHLGIHTHRRTFSPTHSTKKMFSANK